MIALARGGALETVLQNQTGIFFNEPTAEALTTAVQEFERKTFDRSAIQRRAAQFSRERFRRELESRVKINNHAHI